MMKIIMEHLNIEQYFFIYTENYFENKSMISEALRLGENFDVLEKKMLHPGGRVVFYYIDGFVKDEMFEKIAEFVRLETVNDQSTATEGAPYGKANREALDKFMEYGEELGFEVKDYDGYAATLKWGNEGKEIAYRRCPCGNESSR